MPIFMFSLWRNDNAQDIAEYALMAGVLLIIVVLVIQSLGNNANQIFSQIASKMAEVL